MRILIDIGHPFHVHFFKNIIFELISKNHEICILARDKDVTYELLYCYDLDFKPKGKGGRKIIDRIVYAFRSVKIIRDTLNTFKPNVCLSMASQYLALLTYQKGIRHIMFNNNEHELFFNELTNFLKPELYLMDSFQKKIGLKSTRIPSILELAYLHPSLFKPTKETIRFTGNEYILVRFVSETANHDVGGSKWSDDFKRNLISKLRHYKQVYITSEVQLPEDLHHLRLNIPANLMHNVIANASIVIGGSATMSAEAAILGVPSVLISSNRWGYIQELENEYNLVHYYKNNEKGRKESVIKAIELLNNKHSAELYQKRSKRLIHEKVNIHNYVIKKILNE